MEIHLCGLHGLVSQPERDDRAIDAMLQEFHGGGMAKHVRCYGLAIEGRAAPFCGANMTSHQAFYGIPTQGATTTAGEDRSFGFAGTLVEPRHHDADHFVTKGRTSLLSALSLATYMSAGSKNDRLALQADKFRHPQSRLDRHQQ